MPSRTRKQGSFGINFDGVERTQEAPGRGSRWVKMGLEHSEYYNGNLLQLVKCVSVHEFINKLKKFSGHLWKIRSNSL